MKVRVGTFNINNLFSRYNFRGEVEAIQAGDTSITVTYSFTDPTKYKLRSFKGKLVKGKPDAERAEIARRIQEMNLDVLALQEVEDIETLKRFVTDDLQGLYPEVALIEGNDPRLIDVAVLSKLPLGGITSWQRAVHKDAPDEPVFSRDLLQVDVLNARRTETLFTLFNNHLKSQYVPFDVEDPAAEEEKANLRRRQQAEKIAEIVTKRLNSRSRFIIVGDLNDTPDSAQLIPLTRHTGLGLINGLQNPQETRPPKPDNPPPATTAWTHRFKESGKPAEYALFDQIWLSPSLGGKLVESWIDRRKKHSGDGSDHDPAWVVLDL